MSAPIDFDQVNTVWKGWPKDVDRDAVGDLPSFRDGSLTISAWKLTWLERFKAFMNGVVWLHVQGQQQPPVYVSSDFPFENQPKGRRQDDPVVYEG